MSEKELEDIWFDERISNSVSELIDKKLQSLDGLAQDIKKLIDRQLHEVVKDAIVDYFTEGCFDIRGVSLIYILSDPLECQEVKFDLDQLLKRELNESDLCEETKQLYEKVIELCIDYKTKIKDKMDRSQCPNS